MDAEYPRGESPIGQSPPRSTPTPLHSTVRSAPEMSIIPASLLSVDFLLASASSEQSRASRWWERKRRLCSLMLALCSCQHHPARQCTGLAAVISTSSFLPNLQNQCHRHHRDHHATGQLPLSREEPQLHRDPPQIPGFSSSPPSLPSLHSQFSNAWMARSLY